MIVDRVLKKQQGLDPSLELSFKETLKRLPKTLMNETKKISLIVVLSIVSLVLSFIPFMAIVSFFIQVVLLSVTFLDYYWSRKNLSVRECINDYRSNFLFNFLSGLFFLDFFLFRGRVLFFPLILISLVLTKKS